MTSLGFESKNQTIYQMISDLDKDGSGVVTVAEVMHLYDVQQHPEFKAHKKTQEQLIGEFLDGFDGA